MSRLHFGHCIGCDRPIRPPYLSFTVHQVEGNGDDIAEWEEVDTCGECAAKLTASDLLRLVNEDEVAASADTLPKGQDEGLAGTESGAVASEAQPDAQPPSE